MFRQIRQRYEPLTVIVTILVAVLALGLVVLKWTVAWEKILPFYGVLVAGMLGGLSIRALGDTSRRWGGVFRRAGTAVYMIFLFYAMAGTGAFACSVLASSGLPYVDGHLHAADTYLGFDWVALMHFILEHPPLGDILSLSYGSIGPQQQVAILLLAFLRAEHEVYRFMFTWVLCLTITTLMFPLFPAVAAFDYYGIAHGTMPFQTAGASWNLTALMDALRSGANSTLDFDELTGPVTMPSLHAGMAVLLGAVFWQFHYIRWPAVILNMLMFFSAITIGGHYLVDIIAGGLLAVVCLYVGRFFYSDRHAVTG